MFPSLSSPHRPVNLRRGWQSHKYSWLCATLACTKCCVSAVYLLENHTFETVVALHDKLTSGDSLYHLVCRRNDVLCC